MSLGLCAIKSVRTLQTLKYRAIDALALDIKRGDRITSTSDKLKIFEWLSVSLVTQNGLTDLPVNNDVVAVLTDLPTTIAPATKKPIYGGFKRYAFNIASNPQRQHISLDTEFVTALDFIAPANQSKWLAETVNQWIATKGTESTTRIVKLSIVNELLKRATRG